MQFSLNAGLFLEFRFLKLTLCPQVFSALMGLELAVALTLTVPDHGKDLHYVPSDFQS